MAANGVTQALNAYIVAQAHNNRWSNHRLHSACARLSDSEYFGKRPSFFGSIHDHLDHIVYVDWLYLERLTGKQFLPPDVGDLLHRELAPLAKDQIAADQALIDFCQAATPDTLASKVTFQNQLINLPKMITRYLKILIQRNCTIIHSPGSIQITFIFMELTLCKVR